MVKSRYKGPIFIFASLIAGGVGALIGYGALSVSNLPPSDRAVEIKQTTIRFWHDSQRNVGCWITEDGGMSCIPDDRYTTVSTIASDVPVLKTQPKDKD